MYLFGYLSIKLDLIQSSLCQLFPKHAWGCGKGRKREWLETVANVQNLPNNVMNFNNFMNVVVNNNISHAQILAANLPGVTQTTLDSWLVGNNA